MVVAILGQNFTTFWVYLCGVCESELDYFHIHRFLGSSSVLLKKPIGLSLSCWFSFGVAFALSCLFSFSFGVSFIDLSLFTIYHYHVGFHSHFHLVHQYHIGCHVVFLLMYYFSLGFTVHTLLSPWPMAQDTSHAMTQYDMECIQYCWAISVVEFNRTTILNSS